MFLSTLAFFLANSCVKQVGHLPAMELVFFRCIVATAICTVGLVRAKESILGSNHLMLLLRGVFGTTALFTFFVTLQHIPLATAQTLQYMAPVFTAIIAIFVLKESLLPAQFLFYAMAFAGVLLIGKLFGLAGLVIAVPILASIMVLIRHILLGEVYGDPLEQSSHAGTRPPAAEPTVTARSESA